MAAGNNLLYDLADTTFGVLITVMSAHAHKWEIGSAAEMNSFVNVGGHWTYMNIHALYSVLIAIYGFINCDYSYRRELYTMTFALVP